MCETMNFVLHYWELLRKILFNFSSLYLWSKNKHSFKKTSKTEYLDSSKRCFLTRKIEISLGYIGIIFVS